MGDCGRSGWWPGRSRWLARASRRPHRPAAQRRRAGADDPIRGLRRRTSSSKSTRPRIKGLTQFGDRRQGTTAQSRRGRLDRGAAQELRLSNTETHDVHAAVAGARRAGRRRARLDRRRGAQAARQGRAGSWRARQRTGAADRRAQAQGQAGRRGWRRRGRQGQARAGRRRRRRPRRRPRSARRAGARREGGSTLYGSRGRTGVNNDAEAQPDETLRALNAGPVLPAPFPQVYCTKIGTTRPDEIYIIGAHMDGIGWGEAANDDGSGTALVMELARIFSSAGRHDGRDRSASRSGTTKRAVCTARAPTSTSARSCRASRTRRAPAGIPEPKWLGMIQHDMMMWDHGMPRADGTLGPEQRPRGRLQHRVPEQLEDGRGVDEAGARRQARRRQVLDRLSGARRTAHDQHRLDAVHGHHRRRSACARTSAACTPAPAGIRTGTSRPTCSRRSRTRTSGSGSTRRRRRSRRSRSSTGAKVKK